MRCRATCAGLRNRRSHSRHACRDRWIAPGPWLAWREDVVRPPRAARVLASGAVGPEAFTVNGHLGVQFHPEVTPEIVRDWVTRPDRVLDSQGILEATWRDHADALRATRRLAAGFLRSLDVVAPNAWGPEHGRKLVLHNLY